MKITRNRTCRICQNTLLEKFLDLGDVAPVNTLLTEQQLNQKEHIPNLSIYVCTNCWLVQIIDVMDSEDLFKNNYPYFTSFIDTMVKHFSQLSQEITNRFQLTSSDLVVDIGSNDGTFLKGFKKQGISVLGVEPATNVAKVAIDNGIPTVNIFFDKETAPQLKKEYGSAKVIISTNTFAHVDDIRGFVEGITTLLDDEGVFIFENPYLVDTLEHTEFDTMYYEHMCYHALRPLSLLFSQFEMEIFDVKRTPVHGGSILVFVKKKDAKHTLKPTVKKLLGLEKKLGLHTLKPYRAFAKKVEFLKKDLLKLLSVLKKEGKRIAVYGASARGNVLLNYCHIDTTIVEYVADRSTYKHGLYTPGMHIPIVPAETLLKDMPNYVLLCAWTFADEIIAQQAEYHNKGGKFIIPIPKVKII